MLIVPRNIALTMDSSIVYLFIFWVESRVTDVAELTFEVTNMSLEGKIIEIT